jgi:hypothetical protein
MRRAISPLPPYVFKVLRLVKHRNNCTETFSALKTQYKETKPENQSKCNIQRYTNIKVVPVLNQEPRHEGVLGGGV